MGEMDTKRSRVINPPKVVITVFFVLILLGAFLLMLPISAAHGNSIGFIDALFTATSAICVNGLSVLDTGTSFSLFGQIIIMILIQIGGLGFMTFGVMVAIMLGKQIGLKERLILKQTTNASSIQGLIQLSISMAIIAFTFEISGSLILTLRWYNELGWADAFYYAIFHSVSAFNNAGFSLWTDSFSAFVGDPVVNITVVSLFVIGGLGFIVIVELLQKRSWRKLSLHSKVVLMASAILSTVGFLILFLLESWNPATFGQLSGSERYLAAFFQGMTPRSAGFHTIDIQHMLTASQFLIIILMFIGAASGSTGGGIKVNTLFVLILATLNTFRGGGQVHAFERKIPQETIMRALAVIISSLAAVLLIALLLTLTEGLLEDRFLEILFEATSAFSTTGLSMGLTSELSTAGKIIISAAMFVGRLGPLTLAFALSQRKRTSRIGYPEDHVLIG